MNDTLPYFYLGFILLGLAAGTLGGLVGIGGGIIIVPALALLYHFQPHLAQGTSLAALLPPVGVFAVWTYHKNQNVDWRAALLISLGFLIGGLWGAKIAAALDKVYLSRIFSILLIIVGLRMLYSTWSTPVDR